MNFIFYLCGSCVSCAFGVCIMCFVCIWAKVPEIKLMMMMMMIGNCKCMGCDSGVGWCHQDNLLAVAVRSAASLRDYCQ